MKFDSQPLLLQTLNHLVIQNIHFTIYMYFVLCLMIKDRYLVNLMSKHENEVDALSCLSSASS